MKKTPLTKREIVSIIRTILIIVGVIFGLYCFITAFGAYSFESEGHLPDSYFWVLYLLLPFIFLVGIGSFWNRLGGLLMIVDGYIVFLLFAKCLSACSPLFVDPPTKIKFFENYAGPMILLGIGFLTLGIYVSLNKKELSEGQKGVL